MGPDAFLLPPPPPTGQPRVLPAGRQLHTLPQLMSLPSCREAAAGRDMPTAGMASGPVPEAWATLLPKRIRVSQIAEKLSNSMSWTARNL